MVVTFVVNYKSCKFLLFVKQLLKLLFKFFKAAYFLFHSIYSRGFKLMVIRVLYN